MNFQQAKELGENAKSNMLYSEVIKYYKTALEEAINDE